MRYRLLLLGIAILQLSAIAMAQDGGILTAGDFLEQVATRYGQIDNYLANITITRDNNIQYGTISYLRPDKIRIDFVQPAEQQLIADGRDLWIYLPTENIVLQQTVRESTVGFVGEEGLRVLRENYSASFVSSPLPVVVAGIGERVTQLQLTWLNSREHFKELIVYVDQQLLIRRIVGTTAQQDTVVQFDFENVQINQGIPATRFDYDPPASANLYTDFLFDR